MRRPRLAAAGSGRLGTVRVWSAHDVFSVPNAVDFLTVCKLAGVVHFGAGVVLLKNPAGIRP